MSLSITAEWERLDNGPPEERACFAAISILVGKISLTEAEDALVKRLRTSVYLSANKLAEWFAWNWWRQRWEPRSSGLSWAMAHRMSTIGGGYVWPNISVISDGERVVLVAKPTEARPAEPLRYLTDMAFVFRAAEFEHGVSRFIEQVLGQLRAEKVVGTNLESVWIDVCAERADAEIGKRRRLEALLGLDPDEADPSLLDRLVAEEADLGAGAVQEMAAMSSAAQTEVLTSTGLQEIARHSGFDTQPREVVRLQDSHALPRIGDAPAWLRGAAAARELREQEKLGAAAAVSNDRLAAMCGVPAAAITEEKRAAQELAFAIDQSPRSGQVVLRSKWKTGRRFELARLLGDRIAGVLNGRLFPATRAHTYRQKLQRAFAAELLAPFDAVADMLHGDYSDERQEEVAQHFNVSSLTVRTLLVNHRLIERDELNGEIEVGAAVA